LKIRKLDLHILASYRLSFGTNFKFLGQTGWANFKNSNRTGSGPNDLPILANNYKLLFGTDFEVLGQTEWAT